MLQDILIRNLIENGLLGQKIQSSSKVSNKGKFVLDATEKNPNIEDSLAEQIADNHNKITRVKNAIDSIIALPDSEDYNGADAEIAAAKIGPKGEKYNTLQDSISSQIENYKGVTVSNNKPVDKSEVSLWVNTSLSEDENHDYEIPQIKDDEVSDIDTWSSAKIEAMIKGLSTQVVDSSGNTMNLGELINDNDYSLSTVWSSAKTRSEILATLTNINDGNGGTINLLEIIDDTSDNTNRVWSAYKVSTAIEEVVKNSKVEEVEKLITKVNDLSKVVGEMKNILETLDADTLGERLNAIEKTTKSIGEALGSGEDNQLAASDGEGGLKWVTIENVDNVEF